jgi:hypothetical protein
MKKPTPEVNFIYLSTNEIECIFKTCHIISILFSAKCHLHHKYIFFCLNNTFFINHALKFKCQPGHLKVTRSREINPNNRKQHGVKK